MAASSGACASERDRYSASDDSTAASMRVLADATLLGHIARFQRGLPPFLLAYELARVADDAYRPYAKFSAYDRRVLDALLKLRHTYANGTSEDRALARILTMPPFPGVALDAVLSCRITMEHVLWFHARGLTQRCSPNVRRNVIFAYTNSDMREGLALVEWLTRHAPDACVTIGNAPSPFYQLDQFQYLKALAELGAVRIDQRAVELAAKSPYAVRPPHGLPLPVVRYLLDTFPGVISARARDLCAAANAMDTVQFFHERDRETLGCFTSAAMDGAARYGHLDMVQFLHTHRSEGCSTAAMDAAAANGHLHVVKFLHEHRTEGCTSAAMHDAATNGHLPVVQFLHAHRGEGCNANTLAEVAEIGRLDVAMFLCLRRPESDVPLALWGAAKSEQIEILRFLLAQPVDSGRQSSGKYARALHDTARNGNLELFQLVHDTLHPHCCSESPNDLHDAVQVAANAGHFDILRFYLNQCAIARKNVDGGVIRAIASSRASAAMLSLALEHITDRSWRTTQGLSATAAASGDMEAVQLLLERGVACTRDTLLAAAKSGNVALVEYLLEKLPDLESPQMLHEATEHAQLPMLMHLHSTRHHLCESTLLDSAIGRDWTVLLFLHESCPAQRVDVAKLDASVLRFRIDVHDRDRLYRTLAFLLLMRRDAGLGEYILSRERYYRRRLAAFLQTHFPEALRPFRHMPWCCQLRAVRARVERGESLVGHTQAESEQYVKARGKLWVIE